MTLIRTQQGIDTNDPRSVGDRLWESEAVFNVGGTIFLIFYVTGLALWASAHVVREAAVGLSTRLRTHGRFRFFSIPPG